MDLYDDLDTKQRVGQIDGWSSGIKMLQTQLAAKKATVPPVRRDPPKKQTILAPVFNLTARRETDESEIPIPALKSKLQTTTVAEPLQPKTVSRPADYDWDFIDEYDPMWPNEYEKLIKDKRESDKRDLRGNDRDRKRGRNSRFGGAGGRDDSPPAKSGFASRVSEEDSYNRSPPSTNSSRAGGAAIAPPPSLQEGGGSANNENSSVVTIPYGANSVAAKIMAKYGFKDGQGLGKQEQGMSMALQVEKTSKRGGRIIHEKELIMPPPAIPSPPIQSTAPIEAQPKSEPTITEIMKSPSKVVLLRNMVGPGDVDSELEPEVKDECNTKYGEVVTVVIHELLGVVAEEAVRIFVEFKRIESAIKAVVDLNGRFFGGRQVRAGFYNYDKFRSEELND
ncbi:unnamed protein product [Hermetia illucens]|uniref:Splicing factor 45 n=1 Tax=Hermetia illucens TaxID=343691 RepID=A0A7R8UV90_HERIL|nr:splicing factor 45 isoform X1 [Hermetia illucens]CAD7086528.1 unnamed protein product [Hermetia illucens]